MDVFSVQVHLCRCEYQYSISRFDYPDTTVKRRTLRGQSTGVGRVRKPLLPELVSRQRMVAARPSSFGDPLEGDVDLGGGRSCCSRRVVAVEIEAIMKIKRGVVVVKGQSN